MGAMAGAIVVFHLHNSKREKCHTVLDDYSALAIICMLQLLTAV